MPRSQATRGPLIELHQTCDCRTRRNLNAQAYKLKPASRIQLFDRFSRDSRGVNFRFSAGVVCLETTVIFESIVAVEISCAAGVPGSPFVEDEEGRVRRVLHLICYNVINMLTNN